MSIKSRREEERQARIDAIKQSAWKICLRDGLHSAKIADIAKDCRLGLSTLYYYFADKRQIVYSLMLDFKVENNALIVSLMNEKITYREFIGGDIDSYFQDIDRFRFFVLADSYYNYHQQYDLNDPVLKEYDRITRKNGNYILGFLMQDLDPSCTEQLRLAIGMILGFLRRYVLLPARSLPQSQEEHAQMLIDLKRLSCALFSELGMDLDRIPDAPKEPFTHTR